MPAATATVTATTAPPAPLAAFIPPINGFTTIWGITINPSAILLGVLVLLVVFYILKAQRNRDENSFDFSDLVMDDIVPTPERPNRRRKASAIKLTFLLSFCLSSWVLIDQEIKLSPLLLGVYGIYMATWCAALIAKVIFDKKDAPAFAVPGAKS